MCVTSEPGWKELIVQPAMASAFRSGDETASAGGSETEDSKLLLGGKAGRQMSGTPREQLDKTVPREKKTWSPAPRPEFKSEWDLEAGDGPGMGYAEQPDFHARGGGQSGYPRPPSGWGERDDENINITPAQRMAIDRAMTHISNQRGEIDEAMTHIRDILDEGVGGGGPQRMDRPDDGWHSGGAGLDDRHAPQMSTIHRPDDATPRPTLGRGGKRTSSTPYPQDCDKRSEDASTATGSESEPDQPRHLGARPKERGTSRARQPHRAGKSGRAAPRRPTLSPDPVLVINGKCYYELCDEGTATVAIEAGEAARRGLLVKGSLRPIKIEPTRGGVKREEDRGQPRRNRSLSGGNTSKYDADIDSFMLDRSDPSPKVSPVRKRNMGVSAIPESRLRWLQEQVFKAEPPVADEYERRPTRLSRGARRERREMSLPPQSDGEAFEDDTPSEAALDQVTGMLKALRRGKTQR